jgi:hypothetical protein
MSFLAAALMCASAAGTMARNPDIPDRQKIRITIGVDPRVELLSIVFRIAGAEEYQRSRVPSYSADVDSCFAPVADHPAVRKVSYLRRKYGISHDAVVKLAVHAIDASSWHEVVPLAGVDTLGNRWQADEAVDFFEDLRSFSRASGFDAFFEQHVDLFDKTEARLRAQLVMADLAWLDGFFGESSASLRIVAGMLTGRASYGATVIEDSGANRYAIVGVERVDDSGLPEFDRAVVETVVHELCHSYLHPILKEHFVDLKQAGEALYLSQQPRMERQAYRSGYTVMNETLTRACTHRFLLAKASPEEVERDLAYNRSRGFLWIEDVSRELEEYESDRQRYVVFADLMPDLSRFFARYTKDLPRTVEDAETLRPQVTNLVPVNGATDVNPDLEAIEITFDRPMRAGSWSVVGGGPKYPETGTPFYDDRRQVFRLPVKLEPGREYELWLNRGPHQSFASERGVALAPFRIRFRTSSR